MRGFLLPLLILLAVMGCADAQTAPHSSASQSVTFERLQNVPLWAPQGTPKAMVVYFSDGSGWGAMDEANAEALQGAGNVVLGVDMSRYAKELDKDDGDCLYVVGEITELAQTAQRQLDIQTYLPPIVVGIGEGATFAYAALADAPDNTLGGAVGVDFKNRLTLRLPFCPGATARKTRDGGAYAYAFDITMPEAAMLLVDPEAVDDIRRQAAAQKAITIAPLDRENQTSQIISTVAAISDVIEPFGQLPAIDLPSTKPPKAVAVLVSGDGGWRDLDKTVGEWLSTQGVHVVGLDALHYFWAKRTPQELATDVATLIAAADPKAELPVMLIGYSFGAETLPFAFPLLPKTLQDRTKVIGLLAPGQTTSFQITISGWLGIDDSGYHVPAAIAALPADRVICIYGKDDDDSACTDPSVKKTTVLTTDGGHHFDGDYTRIAQKFLDRL